MACQITKIPLWARRHEAAVQEAML
jgi:hypothetical protein